MIVNELESVFENVAVGKSVTGSNEPSNGSQLANIVDGQDSEREWKKGLLLGGSNQWVCIDLGSVLAVTKVVVSMPSTGVSSSCANDPITFSYKLELLRQDRTVLSTTPFRPSSSLVATIGTFVFEISKVRVFKVQ